MKDKVAVKSLKATVYDQVVSDVIRGVYKANDIITENSLIVRFGVSKAPVREALIEMCKDSFLKSLPRLGYQVVPCCLSEMVDILDFRVDLERSNLQRAFSKLTVADITLLKEKQDSWNKELPDGTDIFANWFRNQRFHQFLCSLSGNSYAYHALEYVLKQNARFFAQYYSYAWMNDTESKGRYHEQIIDALENHNLDVACDILEKDIGSVKMQLQAIIQH